MFLEIQAQLIQGLNILRTYGSNYGGFSKFYPEGSSWSTGSYGNTGDITFNIGSGIQKSATNDGVIVQLLNNTSITGAKLNDDSYMANKGPYGYVVIIPISGEEGSTTKYKISGNYNQGDITITSTTTRYIPVGCKVTVTATDSLGNETINTLDLN